MKRIPFSKNNAKYTRSLHLKKYRDKFNKFVAEGDKICREMLSTAHKSIEFCVARKEWIELHGDLLSQTEIPVATIDELTLRSVSAFKTPNQVLIVADKMDFPFPASLSDQWYIYLDGIQDPGNVGTILRIADWFGFGAVFCGPDTADIYNHKVIQASMGAFLRVPHFSRPLEEVLSALNWNKPVYGASMEGQNIFDLSFGPAGILVIGNEGQGIRPETKEMISQTVGIPRGKEGGAESLNAAIATGILCAAIRQFADLS